MALFKNHNLKFIIPVVFLLLSSCSTHPCRCYLLERWGNVVIQETLIDEGTACADLGYDTPHPFDSSFRYCTPIEAPLIDTIDIVRMFWGKSNTSGSL